MPIFCVIHLPLGEGEVSVWVEPGNLKMFGEDSPVAHIAILAEIGIMIRHHQHVECDDDEEGSYGEEPFFLFYLKYIVHLFIVFDIAKVIVFSEYSK